MPSDPTLDAYLDALPAGLDSYPFVVLKASVLRAFLGQIETAPGWADDLPGPLPDLVRSPPPDSAWLPEVHFHSICLAARNRLFPSDASYFAHWRRVNDAVITGRLYRAIFALASPARILTATASRWRQLHRGIALTTTKDPGHTTVRMYYPSALLTRLQAKSFTTAFESVLCASGGQDVKVELLEHTDVQATYDARWR